MKGNLKAELSLPLVVTEPSQHIAAVASEGSWVNMEASKGVERLGRWSLGGWEVADLLSAWQMWRPRRATVGYQHVQTNLASSQPSSLCRGGDHVLPGLVQLRLVRWTCLTFTQPHRFSRLNLTGSCVEGKVSADVL